MKADDKNPSKPFTMAITTMIDSAVNDKKGNGLRYT